MRPYYPILLILCLAGAIEYASAQSTKKHEVGISFGYAYNETRDLLVSPLMYTGGQSQFQLSYYYRGIKNRHNLRISYSNGSLQSSAANTATDFRGGFQYMYHRYLTTFLDNNIRIFAGLIWDNTLSARRHKFQNLAGTEFSGELISSLNLSFLSEYRINKKTDLGLQLIIPGLAYILRPGFTLGPPNGAANRGINDPNVNEIIKAGDVATVNNYLHFRTIIAYEKNVSDSVGLRFEYQFVFYQYKNPRKTGTVSNQFRFEIVMLF